VSPLRARAREREKERDAESEEREKGRKNPREGSGEQPRRANGPRQPPEDVAWLRFLDPISIPRARPPSASPTTTRLRLDSPPTGINRAARSLRARIVSSRLGSARTRERRRRQRRRRRRRRRALQLTRPRARNERNGMIIFLARATFLSSLVSSRRVSSLSLSLSLSLPPSCSFLAPINPLARWYRGVSPATSCTTTGDSLRFCSRKRRRAARTRRRTARTSTPLTRWGYIFSLSTTVPSPLVSFLAAVLFSCPCNTVTSVNVDRIGIRERLLGAHET